jgi:uncharacterized protein
MLQRLFAAFALAFAVLAFAMPSPTLAKTGAQAAKEPTIQQIYDAADKGRMDAANAMIAKVLKNHPESAKAHFVHAQLLAMQDELDDARDALARAKELSPGLKFAKAESVTKLERELEKPVEIAPPEPPPAPSPVAAPAPVVKDSFPPTGSIPWGPIGIVALIVVAYVFFQRRSRAVTFPVPSAAAPAEAPRFSRPTSDSSMGYGAANGDREFPPSPPPGQASNIGGALAAGAVAGVGAVIVGEVLREAMNARREPRASSTVNIFNNSRSNNAHIGSSLWPSSDSISNSDSEPERQPDRSVVDNDFGIKDTSSWDDSSSSSDSGGSSDSSSSDSSSSDSSDSSSSSSDW